MKLTKLWASALALLTLASCSQDVDVVQPQEAPRTRQVHIDLTAGQDANALRVTYGLDSDGKTTGLLMSDKNVILRVAVRRASGETVVQDLEFTKTPGSNHATYSGQITVPAVGTGDYSISGILLREAGVDGKTYGTVQESFEVASEPSVTKSAMVNFGSTNIIATDGSTIEANLPYVSKWKTITLSGGVVQPVTLDMRPFGTLLRIRVKNETSASKTFEAMRFAMNSFSHSLWFDQFAVRDDLPLWSGNNTERYDLKFTTGTLTVDAGQYSPWMYVCVYPRKMTSGLVAVGTLLPYPHLSGPAVYVKTFRTTEPLPHGSVPMTMVYTGDSHSSTYADLVEFDTEWGSGGSTSTRPKLAIEYVAEYNLNQAADGFVADHRTDNAQVGLFPLSQTQTMTSAINISGTNYYVPTFAELRSIFPYVMDPFNGTYFQNGPNAHRNYIETDVKIGDVTRNYISDFYKANRQATSHMYALRFKNTKNCTAYRYSSIDVADGGGKALLVECIYVGLNDAITIDDVRTTAFWTSPSSPIVSRIFPLYGESYQHADGSIDPVRAFNEDGYYATTTGFDLAAGYTARATVSAWSISLIKSVDTRAAIRPWIRD